VLALVFSIVGFWLYFHAAPPGTAFSLFNADPEMAYFVSSLAVFKGQPYVWVHHPGTPLAALGTVLLALTYPFHWSSPDGFVAGAVRHPQVFVLLTHVVLVLANVACVLALGWKALPVRHWSDAVLAAAVPASFFAFLPQAFFTTFYWSHNAMAFPVGTMLLLGLLVALRRGRPLPARTAWALGLGAGALAATQLYFVTWAAGLAAASAALALMRPAHGRRALGRALSVLAAATVGFAISTAPMIPAYPRFFAWLRELVTHQGAYGQGPAGFASWTSWKTNIAWLCAGSPALFIASGLVLAALLAAFVARRRRWTRDAGLWAAAAGLSLLWVATVLLLAKHPSRSYLPAVAAMLPPLLAIALALWRRKRTGRLVCVAVAAIVLLGSVRTVALSVTSHAQRLAYRTAMASDVDRYLSGYAGARGLSREAVLVLWGPLLPDAACYALWMGDQYSDRALHHEVSEVCPSQGLAWSNITVLPDGWPAGDDVPGVLITTEEAARLFPAFAAFGEPELSTVRDPAGFRLAFYRVSVEGGQARAAAR
jgi:hypothetical protein